MQSSTLSLYDELAADYETFWPSASPEVFETLREAGIGAGTRVLDVGVGTGLTAEPLLRGGSVVTGIDPSAAMLGYARKRVPEATLVQGRAESLPFGAGAFDAATAADTFHHLDQPAAFAELLRVVRPGGTIAIWWQTISTEDSLRGHRAAASYDLMNLGAVQEPLSRGFRAFYGAPLAERTIRTVPAMIVTTVADWMGFERVRTEVRETYGARAKSWLDALEGRLLRAYGAPEAKLTVRTLQYIYLGRV
ncbi:MAG: class I SAM-dependent methyltransferase [Candidatus Eremiobacteraeota bacterium]|nr:class I SAM-dependent methyltransferase [Candidatus Eremiobacteraeota bacterium]